VTKASLLLISRNFRLGDSPTRLFEEFDKTGDVMVRVGQFETTADSQAGLLFHGAPPSPLLVSACRDCGYFREQCLGAGLAHTVLEIPALHHKKLKRLSDAGIIDLSRVPGDLNFNNQQLRAKDATISETTFVDAGLEGALNTVVWPCSYLDFETVATVLPLYPGHGCHQQVLTQFSIHHRDTLTSDCVTASI
jgi:hypothetical protein